MGQNHPPNILLYNIGLGRLITYSDLGVAPQGDTGLKVIQPFGQATQRGSVGASVRHKLDIYCCQGTGCVLTFKTQAEADSHMDTGKHCLEVDCESMYDRIRRKWAGMVTGVTFAPDVPSTSLQGENSSAASASAPRPLRWALKVTKRPTRMTDNVKTFLIKKFEDGVRSGKKADPVQVAREMKTLKNDSPLLILKSGGPRSRSAAYSHVRQQRTVMGVFMLRKSPRKTSRQQSRKWPWIP